MFVACRANSFSLALSHIRNALFCLTSLSRHWLSAISRLSTLSPQDMNNALNKNLGRFDLESDRPTRTLKSLLLFFACYLFFFVRSVRQNSKQQ